MRVILLLLLSFTLVGCPDDGRLDPGDDDDTVPSSNDDDSAPADDDDDDSAPADDDDATPAPTPLHETTSSGAGASARWEFEAAYDNVAGGDWYRDSDNETATLAWGESYVMMGLAAMFRATGDTVYLSRLAWHIDGVLASRDDARGVVDYRGVSAACWRNLHYQPSDEPYCYVVHSGMIGYPMAEFARLVADSGLEDEPDADGVLFGDKAAGYVVAAQETVAAHDDQWNAAGYYVFRPDATFLGYPGVDLPLNQSNAMGRLLLVLHDVTGDAAYLDKATALASRFAAQITVGPSGEHLWNYWGGAYSSAGEDVSHAAINVGFARLAAERGVVFDAADLEAFATTFVANVYVDDASFYDHVGGGSINTAGQRPQVGRWVGLAPQHASIYTAVRDVYEADYPASGVSSGSLLVSWALLAEYEPVLCEPFFYYVDWDDPDPASDDDWREATAYGANVLTEPPDLSQRCMVALPVDAPRAVTVQQWDGAAYHDVARWQATGGAVTRRLPYEPDWPYPYWSGGVLFQFADAFVEGDGILVQETALPDAPEITSSPPSSGSVGAPLAYEPVGAFEDSAWWSLRAFPPGARVDPATGALTWTPPGPGDWSFTLELRTDAGFAQQSFVVAVE